MLLLTTKFVKSSHILIRTFFVFLKIVLKQISSSFNINFDSQWEDLEKIKQVGQVLGNFCH